MKMFFYAMALSVLLSTAVYAQAPAQAEGLQFDELKLAWQQPGGGVVKWDVELDGEIVATVERPEYDIFDDLDSGWKHYDIRVRSYNDQGDVSDWSRVLSPWILKPACVGNRHATQIEAIQRGLKALDYYDGAIDGIVGPNTRAAVKAFQGEHGMEKTGKLEDPLLDRLRSAAAQR